MAIISKVLALMSQSCASKLSLEAEFGYNPHGKKYICEIYNFSS